VGCSTSTTADDTNVCFVACQLAVAGTEARRDRQRLRRPVGASVLIFFILLCKLCFYVEKMKNKKIRANILGS
jgi:hypothetical protein